MLKLVGLATIIFSGYATWTAFKQFTHKNEKWMYE